MKPLIVIAGPTCTGKSETAIALAEMIGGEIISADSMQVYRGMDIGTAKLPETMRKGIPHHLIDVADPREDYSVSRFAEDAVKAAESIFSRGHVPIVAGGSGFYIDALLFKQPETEPGTDPDLKYELRIRAADGQLEEMYHELERLDPEYAGSIHPNNRVRIIRALEYTITTGKPYSQYAWKRASAEPRYDHRFFVLDDDRRSLYRRIDQRVDGMIADGLEKEVKGLIRKGVSRDSVAMQGVGYRQMYDHIIEEEPLDEVIASIKTETRHIAKRQLTWLRRIEGAEWIDISKFGHDPHAVARRIDSMIGPLRTVSK